MMSKSMLITNVQVFTRDEGFVPGMLAVADGVIVPPEILGKEAEVLDGHGAYCLPGFIDLHFHGCVGYDVCDGTPEALQAIADYELSVGVTSICPATMTLPVKELETILQTAARFRVTQTSGAALVGLNMEGPFISTAKKGAQRGDCILPPDAAIFERLCRNADGLLKIMGLAPETGDASALLAAAAGKCTVSLAHTDAGYDCAAAAFDAGASHVTHLFNAMPALHHREPGVIAAAAEREWVTAEMICDGVHVHPAMVRMAYRMFGPERLILISDSIRATGLSDGSYSLGGQLVTVSGKHATLSDGTLAGSVTSLPDCVRAAVREMGIPLETAVVCATIHPAKRLGIDRRVGSLEPGKQADLLLWDGSLNQIAVMQRGVWVRTGEEKNR